jgi:hypothetical protein
MVLDTARAAALLGPVEIGSRHLSGEDRLLLAQKVNQVQLSIVVSRGNRIAWHAIGELRMVEWRVRMNWARRRDAVSPALPFPGGR